jgi:hypothetical protein
MIPLQLNSGNFHEHCTPDNLIFTRNLGVELDSEKIDSTDLSADGPCSQKPNVHLKRGKHTGHELDFDAQRDQRAQPTDVRIVKATCEDAGSTTFVTRFERTSHRKHGGKHTGKKKHHHEKPHAHKKKAKPGVTQSNHHKHHKHHKQHHHKGAVTSKHGNHHKSSESNVGDGKIKVLKK